MPTAAPTTCHTEASQVQQKAFDDCITAAFDCAFSCIACSNVFMTEHEVEDWRNCIRLNDRCADLCMATGRALSRLAQTPAAAMRAQVEACIEACQACADECDRHAPRHEHSRECAAACRRCESACRFALSVIAA